MGWVALVVQPIGPALSTFLGSYKQPGLRRPAPAWHAVALVPLMFVFAAVESYAALLGVLRFVGVLQGQKVSEVINKPR